MLALLSPTFLVASFLVIVTPGPDLALVTRMVAVHGRRAAVLAAVGMIAAGASQVGLGLAGLSRLLADSEQARWAVQLVGSLVLVVYGGHGVVRSLRRVDHAIIGPPDPRSALAHAATGFTTTFTNAKVGLFLCAFLPPFVPNGISLLTGTLVLACVHLSIALTWLLLWTYVSAALLTRLTSTVASRLDLVSSAVIAVLGVLLVARVATDQGF